MAEHLRYGKTPISGGERTDSEILSSINGSYLTQENLPSLTPYSIDTDFGSKLNGYSQTSRARVGEVPEPIDPEKLRVSIEEHINRIGLRDTPESGMVSKEWIRRIHEHQRIEAHAKIRNALGKRRLAEFTERYVASGDEIYPEKISPELELVSSKDTTGLVFRFATLNWSIPVTSGYGRRMRYLVKDRQNDKLIGVFALCDPLFNLKARDDLIGWNAEEKAERLVHTMNAYVVGAIPPYNQLLGGKLIASLMASEEVGCEFGRKYSATKGVISGKSKRAQLTMITVLSALGRSSIYNRLKLQASVAGSNTAVSMKYLGITQGFGYFHIPNDHFNQILKMLREDDGHKTSTKWGSGPNWRIRVLRQGFKALGMDESLIKHGISREVYSMPVADNAVEFLSGHHDQPRFDSRLSAEEISKLAIQRWMIPRAKRKPEFAEYSKDSFL